jgi:hypothetical protein
VTTTYGEEPAGTREIDGFAKIASADLSQDAGDVDHSHAEFRSPAAHLCHGPGRCEDPCRVIGRMQYKVEAGKWPLRGRP